MLALQAGDAHEAISEFTRALELDAHNPFSLQHRADAYQMAGELDHALEDLEEIIRAKPERTDLYYREALLLRVLHKPDEALHEAETLVAANPKDAQAALTAGDIYEASGKPEEGMRSFDRAVELGGRETDYLARARHRPNGDLAARQADVEAALKLNPKSDGATVFLTELQEESGDLSGAISTLTNALAARPSSDTLLLRRAILYVKNQEQASADKDLDEVGAHAQSPTALNTVCWSLATAGVELERALKSCDAALAQAPGATAFLDSRGFVLLKLGRLQEAIAAYDEALKKRTLAPTSLYARGIAKQRLGDRAGGEADIAAALVMDATTKETFARYGVN
jgi:tetratricopeptide (TPR) repeat protein